MKTSLLFLLFLIFGWNSGAQNFQLQILGKSEAETRIIDSLKYNSKHKNIKSIKEEINETSKRLSQLGYIDNATTDFNATIDSSFIAKLDLGKKIKFIHIYIGSDKLLNSLILLNKKNNTIELPYTDVDFFLKETVKKLEQNGYALAKLKLINIKKDRNSLYADLKLESDLKRKLNSIIIRHSENNQSKKFPKGYLTQINKKYRNNIFNQKTVEQIHQDFKKFGFVNQVKYPEILFTKDSTKVYVYLEKKNSNTFDGFIGFANNDTKKITLNGYLDIKLENILASGEELSVYWKSDGNDQKTFKASLELPYLLKTPIGLKAQIQVFRQDTTFQNTKTAIDLSYYINHNIRLYLGYQGTESSDIQNLNSNSISDFNNSFITSSFEYTKSETNNFTFPIKSKLFMSIGIGKREINTLSESSNNNQLLANIQTMHTIYLNKKNSINLKSQNYYLQSNRYITNELFRFGGFNSVRGFSENSLQAYLTTSILTEYRYTLTPNLYIHSILDYSFYKNKSGTEKTDNTRNLIGMGLGMGLQTKNGLLKLAVANGYTKNQQFEIYKTIIHMSYNVKF
ncbi:hypothetical protein FLSI110296_13205 [Flavobacterium sinopsychrotolerans]|uniref:Outer membrane protein assembly factor BamA n=1 Tax=Flavobacterium sinopsychrotolerans TaxID=604089 RepID=A0A1H8R4N4_9FLAO|nr:hypothetical protein [Flavobacterium sinopsychrotolerans]SEO61108.1 hypothetical protein SAMN04487942_3203 [Flavobacterium sinopsychrotolerans]